MKPRSLYPAHDQDSWFRTEGSVRDDGRPTLHHGVICRRPRSRSHCELVFLALVASAPTGFSPRVAAQTAGHPDGMDAETVLAVVGTRKPMPNSSVEALFGSCATRGACPGIWNDYCAEPNRAAIMNDARTCQAFDCVNVTVRAAQLEYECTTVPNVVMWLNKNRHSPPVPQDGFASCPNSGDSGGSKSQPLSSDGRVPDPMPDAGRSDRDILRRLRRAPSSGDEPLPRAGEDPFCRSL
jgi:hypothetical protein